MWMGWIGSLCRSQSIPSVGILASLGDKIHYVRRSRACFLGGGARNRGRAGTDKAGGEGEENNSGVNTGAVEGRPLTHH